MRTRYGHQLRRFLKRALCRTLGHLWSAWEKSGEPQQVGGSPDGSTVIYRTPLGGVKLFRTCESCGKYEEKPLC